MGLIFLLLTTMPLAGSITILRRGLRGFRTGDHPVCNHCGLDLFGTPPGSTHCGECGTSLEAPGSIQIGNRRRRWKLVVAGVVTLCVALAIMSFLVRAEVTGSTWYSLAPASLLEHWANGSDPYRRSWALAELCARLSQNKLNADRCASLINEGLATQGDLPKPWDPAWGDFLEDAHAFGKLSADQWTHYLTQTTGGVVHAKVHPRVRLGDPLVCSVECRSGRTSAFSNLSGTITQCRLYWPGTVDSNGGASWQFDLDSPGPMHMGTSGTLSSTLFLAANKFPASAGPGPTTIRVRATIVVYQPALAGGSPPPQPCSVPVDLPITFDLLAADQSTVQLTGDPSLASVIQSQISIDPIQAGKTCSTTVQIRNAAAGLAFDVFVFTRSGERKLGSFACRPGFIGSCGVKSELDAKLDATADVVLRASRDAAAKTVDVFNAWNGELILKNIPVKSL